MKKAKKTVPEPPARDDGVLLDGLVLVGRLVIEGNALSPVDGLRDSNNVGQMRLNLS